MAYLPGARQERFTAEETDVLVRAVKDREVVLYGDGRNPPKIASVKQAWEEIATIVSSAGIPRTSHQCRKRYNDIRRQGKSKLASINRARRVTGGGSASTQDLTPAEDIAASTLTAESVEGFGGFEIGTQSETQAVQPQGTQIHIQGFLWKYFNRYLHEKHLTQPHNKEKQCNSFAGRPWPREPCARAIWGGNSATIKVQTHYTPWQHC